MTDRRKRIIASMAMGLSVSGFASACATRPVGGWVVRQLPSAPCQARGNGSGGVVIRVVDLGHALLPGTQVTLTAADGRTRVELPPTSNDRSQTEARSLTPGLYRVQLKMPVRAPAVVCPPINVLPSCTFEVVYVAHPPIPDDVGSGIDFHEPIVCLTPEGGIGRD